MRPSSIRVLRSAALGLALVACNSDQILAPVMEPVAAARGITGQAAPPLVRFSEIHYDNVGTDVGEAIEISGPAGTDVTGYKIYLYNGSGGATYSPLVTLNGTIPSTCTARGVIVTNYAVNGLQNGDPDAIALVDAGGNVIEFLSYGGTFVATNGPALGMTSVSMGAKESSTTPIGQSLQRNSDGTWNAPAANTFGVCNDDSGAPPPPPVVASITVTPSPATINVSGTQQFTATALDASSQAISGVTFTWGTSNAPVATVSSTGLATAVSPGDANISATSGSIVGTAVLHVNAIAPYVPPNIRFSEIHYDNVGTDQGEAIEIEGPVGTDLTGWSIRLYDGSPTGSFPLKVYGTTPVTGTLASSPACNNRGVISIPIAGIQNGSPDGFALVDNNGVLVEFLSYEGSFTAADGPAIGVASRDIGVSEEPAPAIGLSLHRSADGTTWSAPSASDFGFVNACGGPPPPPPLNITFTGRSATADPALPVGFDGQVFATEKNGSTTVNTTFTWSSDTPAIASVDQNGVFRALAGGTAIIRATATDGTTATIAMPTIVATQSAAPYGGNTEFGDPVDADPSDDFIIRRLEYTTSFNHNLGHPNWVSEKLDATNYGTEDRCNCFTFDPELIAAGFAPYTTADYTGAGAFAGYGIDRGHMTRSADRTSGNLDNARTYYFSNVLPQAAAVNQGPWAIMENDLGAFAKSGKEVYVMSGGAGSKGTVKNEGKIDMPAFVWKVAVIVDHGKGLADVHSVNDLQVIAVIMPNDPNVNTDWTTYKTTVDAVEALSGYDLLSLLPDNIEKAVESGDQPPIAAVTGATTGVEGGSLSFDASGSSDPDVGDALTFTWTFGDGGTGSGATPSHTFVDNGVYTVTVTVTDSHGVATQASLTTTISNVAPTAVLSAPSSIIEGSSFTLTLGSIVEPSTTDLAALLYAFDCGDGRGFVAASGPSIACATTDNGSRTAHARISDKDGGTNSYDAVVNVTNANPTATFTAPASLVEGSSFSLTLTGGADASSIDAAALTYSFDCGDGAGFQAASSAASVSCATTDDGSRIVRGRVADKDGGETLYSASVVVTNAAPIITAFTTPTVPTSTGAQVTASVSFTDVGTADTHTAVITWGDGTSSTVNTGAALQASASHAYASAGFYIIGVTVRDDDGAAATNSSSIIVYDLSAGFVTGGGWIYGPSNTKAHFDIDVRYSRGGTPTGEFGIKSSSPNIDLDSKSFEYLVVAGPTATFRGIGTLNNRMAVGFLVSVQDGKITGTKTDLIRLKVWDSTTGQVLYDTQPGAPDNAAPTTAINGGNITVHK